MVTAKRLLQSKCNGEFKGTLREQCVIGGYCPVVQKKGHDEAFCPGVKDGQVYWSVRTEKNGWFDTKRQEDAIIIGKLISIEQQLKRRKR